MPHYILSFLAHISCGVPHALLHGIKLLRQAPANPTQIVYQPRDWRQCCDPEHAGSQDPGNRQGDGQYSRDYNRTEEDEKRGGHSKAEEGSGEDEACEAEENTADRQKSGDGECLTGWRGSVGEVALDSFARVVVLRHEFGGACAN